MINGLDRDGLPLPLRKKTPTESPETSEAVLRIIEQQDGHFCRLGFVKDPGDFPETITLPKEVSALQLPIIKDTKA